MTAVLCGPGWAGTVIPFEGDIDLGRKLWTFRTTEKNAPAVDFKLSQPEADRYRIDLSLEDIHNKALDFSALITADVRKLSDLQGRVGFAGKLDSRYTLLNKKPVPDLHGSFDIHDDTLFIRSLEFGKYQGQGALGLQPPHRVSLKIALEAADLSEFIWFFSPDPEVYASGDVSGEITAEGDGSALRLGGRLTSFDGTIDGMEYDSILLNVDGTYPKLNVFNTDVTQTDGFSFRVSGTVDLSQQETMDRQIEALAYEPLVDDKGSDREWTLKRFHSEKHAGTTEVKYMMRQDEDKNSLTTDDSSLIGVERKVSF